MKNKITSVTQVLPTDFIQSDEYCVVEPGLTKFNKDQIITHNELLEHLKDNSLNTIHIIPHMSFKEDKPKPLSIAKKSENDLDVMRDKVRDIIEKCEIDMTELIDNYNAKYEDCDDAAYIETADLSNLFVQLDEFIDDHQ